MDCSMPGFPVLHCLPELAQTRVHWVGDAIQSSYPLFPPSSPALSLSQHQGIFQWVDSASGGQIIETSASASVLPMNIQGWFPLGLTGWISLLSKGLPRVFSSITVRKHKVFGAQPSLWSNSLICTWLLEKTQLWLYRLLSAKWYLYFFNLLSRLCHSFPSKEQAPFNFMPTVIIHSDLGAQENKICHCFHFSPSYLSQRDYFYDSIILDVIIFEGYKIHL